LDELHGVADMGGGIGVDDGGGDVVFGHGKSYLNGVNGSTGNGAGASGRIVLRVDWQWWSA
jgi:hypothetical protein